jgi:DNA primase
LARYTPESKERVRDAVDMVDLVSTRSELRRTGTDSYTGLCPFHDERTPSFGVKPSNKVFYCFGCGEGGDAFRFVELTEGVDFKAAMELLADRYGVALELEAEDPAAAARRARRERLLEVLERACGYYERYLWDSTEAHRAREYLAARGLGEEVLRQFRVGYAPSAWDRILVASRKGGFGEDELLSVGLVQRSRERPGSVYDRFRSRITFPLSDMRGRVLGFGARAMGESQGPKYLNTSENDVYHKGRHLFGGHLARTEAAKSGTVVLCEGYTDVIAMHQAGLRSAVGLMGTALTEDQLSELGRMAPVVALALDADSAGQDAMLRAARLAGKRRLELRVVPLPVGTDPADLVQQNGPAAVSELVARAVPFVQFRVERTLSGGDVTTPQARDRLLDDLRPVFAELGQGAMRLELEKLVAARLALPEAMVGSLLSAGRVSTPRGGETNPHTTGGGSRGPLEARDRSERAFLALCIALPDQGRVALDALDLDSHLTGELTRRAALHLRSHLDDPTAAVDDGELARLLAELVVRAASAPAQPEQLEVERLQLELARVDRQIAGSRAAGGGGLTELGAARRQVQAELETVLTEVLDRTGRRRE